MERPGPWEAIAGVVLALPAAPVPHRRPRPASLTPGNAASTDQHGAGAQVPAHYRYPLPDGRGLHVHSFRSHYLVHWDRVDPSVSVLRHFWLDVTRAIGRSLRRVTPEPIPLAALAEPAPGRILRQRRFNAKPRVAPRDAQGAGPRRRVALRPRRRGRRPRGARVKVAPAAWKAVEASRAVVDGLVSRGEVAYGITTASASSRTSPSRPPRSATCSATS